jgi:hypothetical protein
MLLCRWAPAPAALGNAPRRHPSAHTEHEQNSRRHAADGKAREGQSEEVRMKGFISIRDDLFVGNLISNAFLESSTDPLLSSPR